MKKKQSDHLESAEVIDLLRRINEGATSDNTPLSEILRLCMRLGKQLENDELVKWARSEATGYNEWKSLPDYRVLDTEVRGDFYGPFGSGLKNAGIPTAVIDKEHRDNLFKAHMMQPVAELEKLANAQNDNGTLRSSWPADAVAYYQQKEIYSNGLALASAWRVLTQYAVAGILETIRTRVLDFVLQIEGELGVNSAAREKPDEIDKPESRAIDQIVHTTIYGAQNVAIGNAGPVTQNAINVQPGDLDSLKSFLREAGLTDELIGDLDRALEEDFDAASQPGPATQSWLGKVMLQVGKGSLSLASNVSGSMIAEGLMKFFGIG